MPKAFEINDILPETSQLKIEWTQTNFTTMAYTQSPEVKTDNGNHELILNRYDDFGFFGSSVCAILPVIGGVIGDMIDLASWDSLNEVGSWSNNCGDEGNDSCSASFVIISTIGWTPEERTVSYIQNISVNGLAFEDLDPQEEPSGTSNITVNNSTLKSSHAGSNPIAKIYVNNALIYDVASQGGGVAEGFSVELVDDGMGGGQYSLNDGETWIDLSPTTVTGVTQIKFRTNEFGWNEVSGPDIITWGEGNSHGAYDESPNYTIENNTVIYYSFGNPW